MGKFVSIIIPCRNEQDFIAECLDSVVAQNFYKDNLEVLVVDGMSEDKTRQIIKEYAEKHPFIKLKENPKKIAPCALNMGIKSAKGDVIMRMDAHAVYAEDYVSKCLKYMEEYKADNVGGIIKTVTRKQGLMPKAITICLSHFFGAGNSLFRIGAEKPVWSDTVFGGCYKKSIFDKIGLFNENLERSQDMEFNLRLKRAGGKILLAPDIISYYYSKSSLKDFFWHNIKDGTWSVYSLKFVKMPFSLRHYVPLIFVLTLPLSFWPYILVSLYFSFKIAAKEKRTGLFFVMPLVFGTRHLAYGLGSLAGIIKLLWS
jgi:glycosyltransferase involved in cell wall biosynthesis